MNLSLGARLRCERERRGVALIDISKQTKIKASLLEGLERDDLSYWPHGLFGRAYIRAYAQAVRLDPEQVVREFLERHPDPPDEFANAAASEPATQAGRIWRAITSAIGATPGSSREAAQTDPAAKTDAPPAAAPRIPAHRAAELANVARICMRLRRVEAPHELVPMLGDIAELLDATGVVLWSWDPKMAALRPLLTHGYPDQVVARFPFVERDDDNAIAAAFRTTSTCVVDRGRDATGAIVVPIVSSNRCVGVLSVELGDGREQHSIVADTSVIVATLLATFVEDVPFAAAVNG